MSRDFAGLQLRFGMESEGRYNVCNEVHSMRILILLSMIFSFSAFAQTRVKENIKQKSITTSEDGGPKRLIKKPAVVKGKR